MTITDAPRPAEVKLSHGPKNPIRTPVPTLKALREEYRLLLMSEGWWTGYYLMRAKALVFDFCSYVDKTSDEKVAGQCLKAINILTRAILKAQGEL